jgi:hypothetical protein
MGMLVKVMEATFRLGPYNIQANPLGLSSFHGSCEDQELKPKQHMRKGA